MRDERQMVELDESDLNILRELQKDGRISYAELSRKTGIPSSTLHDRVRRLTASGVITGFTVLLDEEIIGFNNAAIIGLETEMGLYQDVARRLGSMKEVVEIYGTTAEFDLMIKVRTHSKRALSDIIRGIRGTEGIDDVYVASILEVFKDERAIPL